MCQSRKIKILNTILLFSMLFIIAAPVHAGKYNWLFKAMKTTNIGKVARELPKLTKTISKSAIKKALPKISLSKITPALQKIATFGIKIEKSGKFGKTFIRKAKDPAELIRQYGRYGPTYLKTAENFSKTVITGASKATKLSSKELAKFGNLSKSTISKFKKPDYVNNAFVSVLKRTGKQGYKTIKAIGKWSSKHPGSATAAALSMWYLVDPEGCTDKMGKIGENVAKAGTDMATEVSEGVGRGISQSIKETWQGPHKRYFLTGIVIIAVLILLSSRIIRRLIFFPFRLLGGKANTYLDKKESQIVNESNRFTNKKDSRQPPSGSKSHTEEAGGLL